jgi:hypothetical protein
MLVFPPIDQPSALATVSNKNGAAIASCITNIIIATATSIIVPLWYYTNPNTEGTKSTAPAFMEIPKLKKTAANRGLLMESNHIQITQ